MSYSFYASENESICYHIVSRKCTYGANDGPHFSGLRMTKHNFKTDEDTVVSLGPI